MTGEPVFVDATGRRHRWVRQVGRGVSLVVAGYLVLLGASFARAPWVPHLSLPGLGSVLPSTRSAPPPPLGPGSLASPAPDPRVTVAPVTTPRPRTSPSGPVSPVVVAPATTTTARTTATTVSPTAPTTIRGRRPTTTTTIVPATTPTTRRRGRA